jgi:hypothetical protein
MNHLKWYNDEDAFLNCTVTGDEPWVHHYEYEVRNKLIIKNQKVAFSGTQPVHFSERERNNNHQCSIQ